MEGILIKLLIRSLIILEEFIIKMLQLCYIHDQVEIGIKMLKDNITPF